MACGGLWDGDYKIPWDDPGFSRRMLREHLSQEHDLASRKSGMIDAQVAWIHANACGGKPMRILDLGCGPGLYMLRLAGFGHGCKGVDFGPASVAYARATLPESCEVVSGDLRQVDFGGGFDIAMMLYGELNVFSPAECAALLRKARAALASGGLLLVEAQAHEAVRRCGQAANSWYKTDSGLFSERPHYCLIENEWNEAETVAVQRFHVLVEGEGRAGIYRSTSKAWTDQELQRLFQEAGFQEARKRQDWPTNSGAFELWLARTR